MQPIAYDEKAEHQLGKTLHTFTSLLNRSERRRTQSQEEAIPNEPVPSNNGDASSQEDDTAIMPAYNDN